MRFQRAQRRRSIYRDRTKSRIDRNVTAEWVDKRYRRGLMIEEDDGTLRPIGMVEAHKVYTKHKQKQIDEERKANGV